ncbi:MAG: phenylalanine--tRNA ligase subunit beta, partial [Singulisphaera sp.]
MGQQALRRADPRAGGRDPHPGVIDVGVADPGRPPVTLRFDQIARVLGIDIPRDRAEAILRSLGLEPGERAGGRQTFRPPSWRADLDREIDLIEEVARIHGYEHIPEDRPVPLAGSARGARERVEAEVRGALTGCGFDEAFTYSLVSEGLGLAIAPGTAPPPIRIEHSSRRRENALRQSLVPSLLAARRHNEAHGDADAHLFEIANVYLPRPGEPLPDEPTRLALVSGHDYLGLKGVVEALLGRLHIGRHLEVRPTSIPLLTPGRAAELSLAGTHLGYLGEVVADRLDAFELRAPCAVAELSFDLLQARGELVPIHHAMPPFPA